MKKQKKLDSFTRNALLALKAAVRDVIKQHKKSGRPIYIWEDGKVKKVLASKL